MPVKRATLERLLDSAWATGLITLFGGLITAIVVNQFPNSATARMTAISLVAALVTTNIARVVNAARDEMKREANEARELLQAAIDLSELGRLAGELRAPFLHKVALRTVQGTRVALRQLAGKAENKFQTRGEYMVWATPMIKALKENGRVLAVCGDKDWETDAVRNFNLANCAAAIAGCHVERIFLQYDRKGFPPGEQRVLEQHLKTKQAGGTIIPWVVRPSVAAKLAKQYGLPSGFGFTFIDPGTAPPSVLLHWGLTDKNNEGLRLESLLLAPIVEQIYKEFRASAYEYDGHLRP